VNISGLLNVCQTARAIEYNLRNSTIITTMDRCNEEPTSQPLRYEMADYAPANPPAVGFLSLEDSVYNPHQALESTGIVLSPPFDTTNEGSRISLASAQYTADLP
jgi:hypothetical protein